MKRALVLGGLAVCLLLAAVVSNLASAAPDGLEATLRTGCRVDDTGEITAGSCMALGERDHEIGGPLADYGLAGVADARVGTAVAGTAGVLLTFAATAGLGWLLRRRRARS
ncbi:MAG TPA: PDGLE domain-containing protein [Pilimelia sp.]|nr:PDGLE domain-containing protein [Pilimelia sp.]